MAEFYRNAWYAQLQKKVAELEEEIRKAVELPTVTSADDGKSLVVDENGKWAVEYVNSNYSIDEQVVGTWIDGKPLYRKTIFKNYNELTTYGIRKGVNVGGTGISVHKIDACAFSNTYGYCPLGCKDYEAEDTNSPYFACNMYYGNVVLEHSNGISGLNSVQPSLSVTVYYTKTTD